MIQHLTDTKPFESDRYLGKVSNVSASTAYVTLAERSGQSSIQAPPELGIGNFVVISCNEFAILGKVVSLRTSPTVVLERGVAAHGRTNGLQAVVELFLSIDSELGTVVQGVVSSPQVGDNVFLAHPKLLQLLIGNDFGEAEDSGQLRISLARLTRGEDTVLSFTPEMIFGRHCAILGMTGGGKSWTLARLVEEVARYRSKVILFDPSGEFASLERHTRHLYLGEDPNPKRHWEQVVLPYHQLTERDLFAIFRPTGQSQGPKLRAAIQSLKLAALAPELAPDGTIIKAHKYKAHYEARYAAHAREIERPSCWFDITKLARQIENECVNPYRSPVEPGVWGDPNRADYASCVPLLNRITDVLDSPNLACIFRPQGKRSLLSEIDTFLENDSQHVLRISLQHVPFLHNAREIIANTLGRYLIEQARDGRFEAKPLLAVLDEAHHFLNRSLEDGSYPLDAFAAIAKEGRKYGLTLCLATQRPRDIPEGVLSQMGTMIIHRLINDQDRSVVERACGELDHNSLQTIPALTPGEAILLGVAFPTPLNVKIERPVFEPNSRGPDYQRCWR